MDKSLLDPTDINRGTKCRADPLFLPALKDGASTL